MARKTQFECDICDGEIGSSDHVDAGVYGRDYHLSCLKKVDGTIIGQLVDDIRYNQGDRLYWNTQVHRDTNKALKLGLSNNLITLRDEKVISETDFSRLYQLVAQIAD